MKEIIQSFAVGLLGCGCGSEVFESIEFSPETFGRDLPTGKRILIGGRLLIYLVPWSGGAASARLQELMRRGRDERDRNGYNRFRLVLAADRPEELREPAAGMFASLAGGDEKLHIHVLPADNELVSTLLKDQEHSRSGA